jgi:hypothetical protein
MSQIAMHEKICKYAQSIIDNIANDEISVTDYICPRLYPYADFPGERTNMKYANTVVRSYNILKQLRVILRYGINLYPATCPAQLMRRMVTTITEAIQCDGDVGEHLSRCILSIGWDPHELFPNMNANNDSKLNRLVLRLNKKSLLFGEQWMACIVT